MTANRNWPQGQNLILDPMKLLGYKVNNGHCLGFSKIVRKNILKQTVSSLNQELEFIKDHAPTDLAEKIKISQQEQSRFAIKRNQKERTAVNDIIDTEKDKTDREKYLHLLYLFDPLVVLQKPIAYAELFASKQALKHQHTQLSDKLVSNDRNESLPITTYVYRQEELVADLKKLHALFTTPKPINYPVSMILMSKNHAIVIGFDLEKGNPWIFADFNDLPIKFPKTEKEMAERIFNAFSNNMHCGFATEISVDENNIDDLRQRLHKWSKEKSYTIEKSQRLDSNKANWIYLAAKFGDYESIRNLLKAGASPQVIANNNDYTPLDIACKHGNIRCVEELLKNDFLRKNLKKNLCVFLAIENNHPLIVELLLKADVNLKNTLDGKSCLFTAVELGFTEVVRELLKSDVNISKDFQGVPPYEQAKTMNNLIIMRMLKTKQQLSDELELTATKSHFIDQIRGEAISTTYKFMNIDFDNQGNIKYDDNIKSMFKQFDTIASDFTKILTNYYSNNKNRQKAKNELEHIIINAYKAYNKNPKNVDCIINELLKSSEKLATEVNESHKNEQNIIGSFFNTTSRLHTNIQDVVKRYNAPINQDKFINKCA